MLIRLCYSILYCYRQMSLLPSNLVTDHGSDNSEGVKGAHHQSPAAMGSDDSSLSSSPSGGGGCYVPSMLEPHTAKHTSHVVDLHRLGTYCVLIWCHYIYTLHQVF